MLDQRSIPPDAPDGAERDSHRSAGPPEPAIGDYAIIGDCGTAALVSRSGAIDWLCMPHFSGSSAFAALLDRQRGGSFSIRPVEPFEVSRRYVGETAVLETTFTTAAGTVRLTDAMIITPHAGILRPLREVLRVVEGLSGEVLVDVRCEPRPDFGRVKPLITSRGALGHAIVWGNEVLTLAADIPLQISTAGEVLHAQVSVAPGRTICLSLGYTKGEIGVVTLLGEAAHARLSDTLDWWRAWTRSCTYDGPHAGTVLRSAVTLKLMTFAVSGAVVAAPTTSLPEAIGGGRNYDYRFCWLRDAALTMKAFLGLGFRDEARSFLLWLLHTTRLTWPELQIFYDVHGRADVESTKLDHLAGYRGSRPVRIGNDAKDQVQLDIYAGVVSAALYYVEAGGHLQADEAKLLGGLSGPVLQKWHEPDNGIWEIPDPKREYTWSKVMCWAALDGLLRLSRHGVLRVDEERLRSECDAIAEVIESRGFNETLNSYTSELDGFCFDAALLLMSCMEYKEAGDPRMRGTYDRIQGQLGRGGLLYRYEDGYDGLPALEGAFGICSFWAVDHLAKRGDIDEAQRVLNHILSFANDVGLFAEQIDLGSGAPLGNFPQAFTHVGVINAATALAEARRAAK